MASSSDRPINANVTLNDPVFPLFDTLDMPVATTEYTYVFPTLIRRYRIKNRTRGIIKYSNLPGFTDKYETIWPGEVIQEDTGETDITLYFQSPVSSQTLEIISWV